MQDPTRSILGPQQKAYLFDQLSQAQSGGQIWKIIGQQVTPVPANLPAGSQQVFASGVRCNPRRSA